MPDISSDPPDYADLQQCRCLCHRMDAYVGSMIANGETTTLLAGMHDEVVITTNVKPPGAETWPARTVPIAYDFSVRHSTDRTKWCCARAVREYDK